jgi:SWI/SNF-related matrix-associated actin-dependent regulator 1 of chromatin subfamily A
MLITSKYPGKCTACGGLIAVGDSVSWTKGIKGVTHAACSDEGRAAAEAVEQSRATDANVQIPAPEGLDYLPYQRAGIRYAMGRSGTLIGDEMGLGKTIQAIGLINACPEITSVLVISPKSLTLNWVRELRRWLVRDMSVSREVGSGAQILVVSYEEAKKFQAALEVRAWDLVVVDEAHWIKNQRAARSKTVHAIGAKASRRVLLTGTPISNRPIELFSLLKLADPEHWDAGPKGGFFRFARRYADAHHNGYGWDFSGAANLPELQNKLRATCMVRRLKSEVLTELPAKRRQIVDVDCNGASRAVAAERAAWDRQEEEMNGLRAQVELAKAGSEVEYETAVRNLQSAAQAAFTEIARLRHDTAVAKVPKVLEHIQLALEDDDTAKIVVFAHHHDVISALRDGLAEFGAVELTGETKLEDRQAAVDRFQTDPTCRVFVGSITAAGVGITLTASSHVVFAELDWVPGNISQAEDRCHRIGQQNSVLVQHLVLDGSLDGRMARILVAKQRIADAGLDTRIANEPTIPSAEEPSTASTRRREIDALAEKLTSAQVAWIHQALRLLAGMCDGAKTIDNCGFSKIDVRIGHELAARSTLSPRQAALGAILARKYRRQVGEMPAQATVTPW